MKYGLPIMAAVLCDSSQQSVTVPTVKKLCDGLGITLVDFFNASIFTTIDQEIR